MKALVISGALASAALFLVATHGRSNDTGLTVHEWGTFTSVASEDGTPADWNTLGCKSDLPGFINDYGFRGFKASLSGTVRMETPVLYFYSQDNLEASVKVSFPNGLITEWYPKSDYHVFKKDSRNDQMFQLPSNLNGFSTYLTNQTGVMEWKSVQIQPGATPEFPLESAPSRYYAARATDAAPLSVGDQHEKFLFYRGVARIPVPLSARVSDDGGVIVENTVASSMPALFLFENRHGAIGYRNAGSLESGVTSSVTLDRPVLDGSSAQLKATLQTALIAQGLYPKEAAAMIDTWHDSWFEEGSRLIYVLPESVVDTMLPLEINPAPSRIARVFVGRIELITSETKRAVREALVTNDKRTLALYRRFLEPIGKSLGETTNLSCRTADEP